MSYKILQDLFNKYPSMQINDLFKFLHQSCFGCEHLCPSYDSVLKRIFEESVSVDTDTELIQPLDGSYSRVGLSWLERGLSSDTLSRLFVMSAHKERACIQLLEHKLDILEELVRDGRIALDYGELTKERREWCEKGYPAIHHSDVYRDTYRPSYRVISNEFVPFLDLLCEIDKRLKDGKVRLAIEGTSASGKTTLAAVLNQIYGCTVFHMDDFFLRPEQRTSERFLEPGGNVDRERFLAEILVPMSEGKQVTYRPFNCTTLTLDEPVRADLTPLTVTEGAYSMHPDLSAYYDLSVFMDISPENQKERIEKRNPNMAYRFFNEWIPLEHRYFEAFDIKEKCDFVINIK